MHELVPKAAADLTRPDAHSVMQAADLREANNVIACGP
jgi:hypothetical protein